LSIEDPGKPATRLRSYFRLRLRPRLLFVHERVRGHSIIIAAIQIFTYLLVYLLNSTHQ